jgi:hypothetical protein
MMMAILPFFSFSPGDTAWGAKAKSRARHAARKKETLETGRIERKEGEKTNRKQ